MLCNTLWTLISIILQIGPLLQVYAKRKDPNGYKTTYACEGRTLRMHCDEGIIHLIRANYGRFSISICNDHGNLEWSVNCMSHQSFLVMTERCSLKPNCSINVSSNTFHDPCPGTLKYLEVQYHCGKDPPIINVHPSSSSHLLKALFPMNTSGTTSGPPPAVHALTFTPLRTTVTTVSEETPVSIPWSYEKEVKEIFTQINVTTEVTKEIHPIEILPSPTMDYSNANYCAPTTSRGINWMWTKAGDIATENCPEGATGNAQWHCLLDTVEWHPEQPDLHQCRSLWIENLKERLENGEPFISVTSELAEKSLAKPLFSADLQIISDMIKQALYKSANSMENFLDTWHRYNLLRELLQCFVQILNNLLETKQSAAWTDLPALDRKKIISSLLHGLDESALLLSEISSDDGSFSLAKSNVLISLQILNSKTLTSFHFPMRDEIHPDEKVVTWLNMQDSVSLPRQAVKEYSTNGLYKVVFTAFNKLNTFLKPSSSFPYHSESGVSGNVTRIINSKIIGASLDRGGYPKLHQPAVITFKHLIEENVTNPICVYWDFHFRDWSTQGCWVKTSNRTHTVCFCEHLTNFALVMDLRPDVVIPLEMETVHIVVAIGSSIAIFSFLVTNIMMVTYDLDMPDDGVFIHKNIFFCLLLAEVVLVGGNKDSVLPLVCDIMAGCLQYLLLATFSWMLLECYHQYGTLVRTCDVKKRSVCWYYAAAYIVPGLVTGISAAVSPSTYGSGEYCWLQVNNYFIFSFVTPVSIMILGGFIFIILSVCTLSQNVTVTQEKDSVALIKHRYWNRRSLFLIISSSVTWTVGLLFLSHESLFLAYTFSVLNSAHSGTLMILYCFCYEKDSRDIRSIFSDFFWKKNKEQEPRTSEQPVMNVNESLHSSTERFRSLKKEKLYEKASTKEYNREEGSANEGTYKYGRGSVQRGIRAGNNWNYASRNALEGKSTDSSSSGECRQMFAASPESSGQFFDHIYEAIDEQTGTGTHHSGNRSYPPAENYYGDHSDISQQSSSSSSYNHQTPQVQVSGQGQTSFPNSYSLNRSPAQEQAQELDYTWNYGDKVSAEDASETKSSALNESNENSQSSVSGVLWQKNSFQNWEPQLSNILQSPTENSVVLAVLEGDKVVSRIQPDDPLIQQQYKLSTFY